MFLLKDILPKNLKLFCDEMGSMKNITIKLHFLGQLALKVSCNNFNKCLRLHLHKMDQNILDMKFFLFLPNGTLITWKIEYSSK